MIRHDRPALSECNIDASGTTFPPTVHHLKYTHWAAYILIRRLSPEHTIAERRPLCLPDHYYRQMVQHQE